MSPDRKFHRTNDKVSLTKMLRGEKKEGEKEEKWRQRQTRGLTD